MSNRSRRVLLIACVCVLPSISLLGACASDEPVGHSQTTTKTTVNTPTGKQTVTETKKKDTTVTPR